jgi:putative aminopeptidase FrvX
MKYHYKDAYLKNKMASSGLQGSLGTTELGRIISATKGKIQGATLQIPTIGYHTVNETASKKSVDSVIKILTELYIH